MANEITKNTKKEETKQKTKQEILIECASKICLEDLITMFNCGKETLKTKLKNGTLKESFVEERLREYMEDYESPFTGDIIEWKGVEYIVTCAYTDNSVDLINRYGEKIIRKTECGLYDENWKKIGKLEIV